MERVAGLAPCRKRQVGPSGIGAHVFYRTIRCPTERSAVEANSRHILQQPIGCYLGKAPSTLLSSSRPNKTQQIPVYRFGLGCAHAVREALVDFERRVLDKLGGQECGVCNRDYLIVIAVHD